MKWLAPVILLLVFSCAVGVNRAPARAIEDGPIVGAIRYDDWYAGSKNGALILPEQWHYRLPFYTTWDGSTPVVDENNQATIETEIGMAIDAGIDYWAFDYGSCKPMDDVHNYALNYYLQSANKQYLSFCLIVLPTQRYITPETWAAVAIPNITALVSETAYQRVLGGRPLIYFLAIGDYITLLGEQGFRDALSALRSSIIAAGNGNPYLVSMGSVEYNLESYGFDAESMYAIVQVGEPVERPHIDLKNYGHDYWDWRVALGHKFIPTMCVGWDFRPIIERVPNIWYTLSQPYQLTNNLNYAINWVSENQVAVESNTVLIYAWNEFSEGGWICPTISDGGTRLQAIKSVLNP